MTPLPHHYHASLAGGPTGYAVASAPGIPDLCVEAPTDFGGPGDAWSPEHLLLAAVQACFLLTLRAVARASGVTFTALVVEAVGTVDRTDGGIRFTEIVLSPRVTVPAGTDRERVIRVMEKSEKSCLVSASIATPIRLEPHVIEA